MVEISAGRRAAGRDGRELAEEPADDEHGLLADVHRVVADALERPRDHRLVHGPLADVGVVADLDGHAEDLAVEAVDLAVLAGQVGREVGVPVLKGRAGLDDLRARGTAHAQDQLLHLRLRSTCLMTCSRAATSRRSVATGDWSASSERTPWWTSR